MLLEGMHRRLSLFGALSCGWATVGERLSRGGLTRILHRGKGLAVAFCSLGTANIDFVEMRPSRRTLTVKMSKHQLNIHMEKSTPIGSTLLLPLKSGCAADVLASFWRGRGRCAAVAARAITRVVEGARRGRAGPAGKTRADPAHSRTREAPNSSARPDKGGGATKGETPWLHPTSPAAAS